MPHYIMRCSLVNLLLLLCYIRKLDPCADHGKIFLGTIISKTIYGLVTAVVEKSQFTEVANVLHTYIVVYCQS